MSDCIFCGVVAGTVPAEIVYEDEHAIAFMDIAPIEPGHTLVIPREHCVDLFDIGPERGAQVMRAAVTVANMVRAGIEPDGINLLHASGAAAWQTVFHFHLHILPRTVGDGVRPMFFERHRAAPEDLAAMAARIRV